MLAKHKSSTKGIGPSKEVAKEFSKSTKKSIFLKKKKNGK